MKEKTHNFYVKQYKTPAAFSDMVMLSDGKALTGLYFKGSPDALKFCDKAEKAETEQKGDADTVFKQTEKWLDIYFAGKVPDFIPEFSLDGETDFQKRIAEIMLEIPYGKSVSYGEIAKIIAKERGAGKMSAQAVGGAVGANRLCIIIPCHRVLGKNDEITGYGGGIENKKALLNLEKIAFKN